MERAGFAATCNPMGAGKWRDDFNQYFQAAEVIIIADRDEPGRKHAADVAKRLKPVAGSVKIIECPGVAVKDAHDYFATGGEPAELDELAQNTPEWSEAPDSWLSLIQDGSDILKKEIPPLIEVVRGIVALCSKLLIASGAKSFKTWLTIHLSLSIAMGRAFLIFETTRHRVLYVNLELKADTFERRVQAIARALEIEVDKSWFLHLPLRGQMAGQTVHSVISRLVAIAKARQVKVIVIDPSFKLNIEGEENSSRDQTVFANEIDRLTTEAACTVILNDHSGKGNQSEKDPLDVIRGSSAKGGDLDAAMVLRRHEVEDCFRIDMVHRELPPVKPFTVGWKYPLMHLRPDLSAEAMKKSKAGRKRSHDPEMLCAAISEAIAPETAVSISAWAKAAGINRTTFNDYLPGLRAKGWIATAGEGNNARQYLTDKGLAAAKRWKGNT